MSGRFGPGRGEEDGLKLAHNIHRKH
jgi:hypothetical protein